MSLTRQLALLFLLATSPVAAQVRVSGRIVEENTGIPISGALVRITGSDSTMTTGASGTFSFGSVVAGGIVLSVAAPAYQLQSIPFAVYRDTVLEITMKRRVVALDPMVIRPRQVKIKGAVLDSATGEPLLFATVSLYPEGRFVEASNIGRFTLDKVNTGEIALVVEAMEHLPVIVRLDAHRDTTVSVRMPVDSVAIRIMGAQVTRLIDRADAVPYTLHSYNRDLIRRESRSTVGELVDRLMLVPPDPRRRQSQGAQDACVFYDDKKIAPGMLDGLYPELIERVEVYNKGDMIRVYSKQYVMSLAGRSIVPRVVYLPIGLARVCE